ncbi:hypothetical protein ABPG74_005551 [Tetrahymena malaccensis]
MDTVQQQQQQDQQVLLFKKQEEIYTGCYCEENVYKLCEKFEQIVKAGEINKNDHAVFAVFITNQFKQTYVKQQVRGDSKNDYLVMWDYHVILVHKDLKANKSYVYDFDTKLSWGCKFEEYFIKSLLKKYPTSALQTMYRVVESATLIEKFASDRSHMVGKVVKGVKIYQSQPPKYDCIVNKNNETNNLFSFYLDVSQQNLSYGNNYMNEIEFNQFIKNYQIDTTQKALNN